MPLSIKREKNILSLPSFQFPSWGNWRPSMAKSALDVLVEAIDMVICYWFCFLAHRIFIIYAESTRAKCQCFADVQPWAVQSVHLGGTLCFNGPGQGPLSHRTALPFLPIGVGHNSHLDFMLLLSFAKAKDSSAWKTKVVESDSLLETKTSL